MALKIIRKSYLSEQILYYNKPETILKYWSLPAENK